jgi:hypothetical protein
LRALLLSNPWNPRNNFHRLGDVDVWRGHGKEGSGGRRKWEVGMIMKGDQRVKGDRGEGPMGVRERWRAAPSPLL